MNVAPIAEQMRVQGTVQGVGFRPTVWRIASELGVFGSVVNDGQGVLITAVAPIQRLDTLARRLQDEAPPLARISRLERRRMALPAQLPAAFVIGHSLATGPGGAGFNAVAADAATCAACLAEIFDPLSRRFRYPFANCTHCGPRLSLATGVPYDRPQTTMAAFPLCADCLAEYHSPADRRFHAQPIACPACGPRLKLQRMDGGAVAIDGQDLIDDCDAAGALLAQGLIVAIKGLGGYQLACDATQPAAVARLRGLKCREAKPFALMAADVDAVRAWCRIDAVEAAALQSAAAPIVLLARRRDPPGAAGSQAAAIADAVAPGLATLGFMLPATGLHHLVLRRMPRPIVLTSANLSGEPQAITLQQLAARFPSGIDVLLDHDRAIARRVDDSLLRVIAGVPRLLRRARGLAPTPIALPAGFEAAPTVLAHGGEQKNSFCLLRAGQALLSQHIGDLADAAAYADYRRALADLQAYFGFRPQLRACDAHPDYLSSNLAREAASQPEEVLHHHAHVAACLVDNGWPLDGGPVLGVALDGLGWGEHGALWGGEFAIADYRRFRRCASFKPVALIGGEQAMREPWRNTYAQLMAELGWPALATAYADLELVAFLHSQPRALLDAMLARGINSPLASSCGRLFDAVAAAMGLCRERLAYEGQGAMQLEALVDEERLQFDDQQRGYPFAIRRLPGSRLPTIAPLAMWRALLDDLRLKTPLPTMAARFHLGLAQVICEMVDLVARLHDPDRPLRPVALSGGVFQNRVLHECVSRRLAGAGYQVLSHRQVPCNDGGLALGQAAVAAARALSNLGQESAACA